MLAQAITRVFQGAALPHPASEVAGHVTLSGGLITCEPGHALDAATRERIANLKVRYVHRNPAYNPTTPPAHPLICTHPDTRRKMLFVSPSSANGIEGMNDEEGKSLLNQLLEHATQDKLVWRHQWRVGDVMVWDNRATLHRRDAFDPAERRLMWRTQMLGPLTV